MTRAIARARGARAVHPVGVPLHGELRAPADSPLGGLIGDGQPVAARMSKGGGLPGAWPDVLGLAVRLPGPIDLLFSTVGPLRIPFPRANWGAGRYDSIVPYRIGGGLTWLAAYPGFSARSSLDELRTRDRVEFVVAAAGWVGRGRAVAVLSLRPGGDEVDWFDPMRHPLAPIAPRWFAEVRERAYARSRQGRGSVAG